MTYKESRKQHVHILKHVKQCLTTNLNINGPSKLKINGPKISLVSFKTIDLVGGRFGEGGGDHEKASFALREKVGF